MKLLSPEVDMDISSSAVDYALALARQADLGPLEKLLVWRGCHPTILKSLTITQPPPVETAGWLSPCSWMLLFERGAFVSYGP